MKIEQIKVVAGLILQNNKLLICDKCNFGITYDDI